MLKNIVFMGTSSFAVPILKSLYQNGYSVSCVYTQPPKKSNRGQRLNKSPINLISETLNLEVRTPERLKNNIEEEKFLKKIKPDLSIVGSTFNDIRIESIDNFNEILLDEFSSSI